MMWSWTSAELQGTSSFDKNFYDTAQEEGTHPRKSRSPILRAGCAVAGRQGGRWVYLRPENEEHKHVAFIVSLFISLIIALSARVLVVLTSSATLRGSYFHLSKLGERCPSALSLIDGAWLSFKRTMLPMNANIGRHSRIRFQQQAVYMTRRTMNIAAPSYG